MIDYIKKNRINLYLKFVLGLLSIPAFLYLVMITITLVTGDSSEGNGIAWAYYVVIGIGILITVPYLYVLVQSFILIHQYEIEELNSTKTMKTFDRIKGSSLTIAFLLLIMEIPIIVVAEYDDAPGLIVFNIALVCIVLGVYAFTVLLKQIISNSV